MNKLFICLTASLVLFGAGCDRATDANGVVLPDYGKYDTDAAKKLILKPFKAIADPKTKEYSDHQLLGYGLLGASLYREEEGRHPMLGYRSLFLGGGDVVGLYGASSKLEATFLDQENIYLIEPDLSIAPTNSIIRKREAVIYGVAFGLTDRFTYRATTHELVPQNEKFHINESDKQLKRLLLSGDEVFDEIKRQGYEDLTLKYALGLLVAALKHDGVDISEIKQDKFGSPQTYLDALNSALNKYPSAPPSNESAFLKVLANELSEHGPNMLDLAFFRKNSSVETAGLIDDTPALIKIISNDLDVATK